MHRALVSRAFTPGRMRELEDKIRAFCAACLDPLDGDDRFDFVLDLGAQMPVRAIGMLMGIPDADQPSVRDAGRPQAAQQAGRAPAGEEGALLQRQAVRRLRRLAAQHPSDDLVTELLNVEFEDETADGGGCRRRSSSPSSAVIAGAGVETTGRLFGWMGKVLAEHPDQREEVVEDRSLVANTIEELLRFEPPGPHVAR